MICFSLLVFHCFQFSFTVCDGDTSYACNGKIVTTSLVPNLDKGRQRRGGYSEGIS